ncbi:hypothetical protein HC928_25025 [bacterium]|nr:hypothetical protein [bacterium]
MDWALIVNFATTIIAILNPLGNLLLFVAYTAREPRPVRRILAFLLAITILFFLLIFLFAGQTILQFFGVSLVAFQIAGGILLLLIGIGMIQGKPLVPSKNL